MSKESHRRPTTIGSELVVLSDTGDVLGYIGETREGPHENLNFYARPEGSGDVEWFRTKEEATAHLKGG